MRSLSPHPRIPALAIALVALTALLAGCGDDGDDASSVPPGGAQQLLEEAVAKPIESAAVKLQAGGLIPNFPILGSRLKLTGEGPIVSGTGSLPTLDWTVRLAADGQTFPARLRAVNDKVYIDFMGISYEADPEMVEDLFPDDSESSKGGKSLAQLGIDPSDWLRKPRVEDGEEIGGDSTRKITGAVNVSAVVEDLVGELESSGIADQFGDSGGDDAIDLDDLSDDDRDKLVEAVKDVDVQVNVDDEGYPRRAYAKLEFVMPKDVKDTEIEKGTVTFDLVLEKIGDVQADVTPPASPRDLDSLFRLIGMVFGIDEVSDLWRKVN